MQTKTRRKIPVTDYLILAFLCYAVVAGLVAARRVFQMRPRRAPAQLGIAPDALRSVATAPEDLLLSRNAFPKGWRLEHATSSHTLADTYQGPGVVVTRTYVRRDRTKGSSVNHAVLWHPSEAGARRNYEALENPAFYWHKDPWEELVAWGYKSPHADEQNLVCLTATMWSDIADYRCFSIARYGHYISRLSISVVPEHMDPDQVKEWIVAADRLFADVERLAKASR